MPRKYNTKHTERGRSSYGKNRKSQSADRYGTFREGRIIIPDRLNTRGEDKEDNGES